MSTKSKSMPGMVKNDPWREAPVAVKAPRTATSKPVPVPDNPDADWAEPVYSVVELKGYGGITVTDISNNVSVGAKLLAFCVDNLRFIDNILIQFGVLVDRQDLPPGKTLPFFIKREDGWLLAIPDCDTRDTACLQLIQAFLKMYTVPEIKTKLDKAGIKPYVY